MSPARTIAVSRKDYDLHLEKLWHNFKRWCSQKGFSCSTPMFSVKGINRGEAHGFAMLHAKAANTKIILK